MADASHRPPRLGPIDDEKNGAEDGQGQQRRPEDEGGKHETGDLVDLAEHVGCIESLGAPPEDHQPEVLEKERDADGRDEGRDAGGVADRHVGALVHHHTQDGREDNRDGEGGPPGKAEHEDAEVGEVASHHHDVAVGEVDEPDDPVDHGVADGDEAVEAPQCHAVDHLLEEESQFQKTVPNPERLQKRGDRSIAPPRHRVIAYPLISSSEPPSSVRASPRGDRRWPRTGSPRRVPAR